MAAWTAARAGHGRVVLITGEAGIGKTRLVAELARRAENAGARTAIGAGVDVGGAAPLATWQELVPQLARGVPAPPEHADWPAELGRLAPDIAARLGRDQPPPPVSSPELERLRVFDAVLRLVEWAAAGRPVLLVAEDVHRADPASMQLCAHIGRRLAARPVLFVLTRRDKPDRPDADALLADLAGRGVEVAELELGPLAAVELAAVARSVADLTDHAVDQVIRAADGNPLLAVESARALAAGRDAPPQNLRAAVRAATGALARPARDLAEMLAAAGRELSAAELAAAYLNLALADRDAAEAAVLDTGLVVRVRGGLRFRHALLAEAVRADLGEQGRRYEQLALAIEAAAASPDQVAAEVAGHLHRAGRDDLAGPRWQRAARHARSLGAMPEAARFWAEAVRCDPEAADLRLELAEAFGWLGQDADFEREWQAALELLPEERQSVAWSRRGQVHRTVVCNPRASLAAYQRAAELLPADAPPPLRVEILLGTAWGESAAGDPARAAALLDEVASLVTEPDDRIVAEMANAELMSVIRLGRFTECEAVAARGGAAARRAGRPARRLRGLDPDRVRAERVRRPDRCAAGGGCRRGGDPRHDGDRVSVPGRPGLRAVPARPPRRGAVAGPRAAGHGGTDGLARDRGPGPPRRRADLAGGRAPSRGGTPARAGPGRGGGGEPAGRTAGPGRGPGPLRPPGRGHGRGAPGGAGARAQQRSAVGAGAADDTGPGPDRPGPRRPRRSPPPADRGRGWLAASPGARPRRGVRGQLRRPRPPADRRPGRAGLGTAPPHRRTGRAR